MKRLAWRALAACSIAAMGYFVVIGAHRVWTSRGGAEDVIAVRAAPVRKAAGVFTLRLSGKLAPLKEIEVTSPLAGRVTEILFKAGDAVLGGALVATIHSSAVTQRIADHETTVAAAAQELRVRERQLDDAAKRLESHLDHYSRDLIAGRDLEEVRGQTAAARAQVEFARARLAQQQAMLAQSRALGKLGRVTAPSDGVVSRILAAPGALVPASAPIFVLADTTSLKLTAIVEDELLPEIYAGLPAEIYRPQVPERKLAGTVVRVDMLAGEDQRRAQVEIHASSAKDAFRPGLPVEAVIPLERRQEALFAPASAVVYAASKTYVYLVSADKASKREVAIGAVAGADVEIKQGLAEGDWVIVEKLNLLKPGSRVRTSINEPGTGQ